MFGYIYITTNLINGKSYIGKKVSPVFVPNYYGSGLYLMRALKKYGTENFDAQMLCTADNRTELEILEIDFISRLNCCFDDRYYNINSGGTGFGVGETNHMTKKEYKEKYSKMLSGSNNPMYKSGERGIHPKGMLGKKHTIEARRKMGESQIGDKNPCQKGFWSEEGRTHPKGFLGGSHKNTTWKHAVRVKVHLLDNSIHYFDNMSKASRELNIPRNVLQKSADRKTSYKNPQNFPNYSIYNGIICEIIKDNTEVS